MGSATPAVDSVGHARDGTYRRVVLPARLSGAPPTVVIVAGCLIGLVSFGLRSSFGLFTEPLTDVRGWSRETFALAIAVDGSGAAEGDFTGLSAQARGGGVPGSVGGGRVARAGQVHGHALARLQVDWRIAARRRALGLPLPEIPFPWTNKRNEWNQ